MPLTLVTKKITIQIKKNAKSEQTLSDGIVDFQIFLKACGRASSTIDSYCSNLQRLVNVLGNLYLNRITSEHLSVAVVRLQVPRKTHSFLSPVTMNKIKSTLRSFFDWAYTTGRCSTNPSFALRMARTDSRRTVPIKRTEIEVLLKTIRRSSDTYSFRDEALFSVYAFSGIRRSEALKLTIRDFDSKGAAFHIANPKGGKSRLQPIPNRLFRVLSSYIEKNFLSGQKTTLPLFPGLKSEKALSAKQAWVRFEKWKILSGIRMNLTIHSFRAGYATMLYRETGDILLVARAMGHTDIKTTDRYIENDIYPLHDILAKIFP